MSRSLLLNLNIFRSSDIHEIRKIGGAEEDRTPDLLRARQALSQLSYGPVFADQDTHLAIRPCALARLVGLGRFERPTSPLSGVRSNQLSYRPKTALWHL